MPSNAAQELQASIKQARQHALESNYDAAVAFYSGLDKEIANHIATIPSSDLKASWDTLRIRLRDEKNAILDIQGELRAFTNPAEGVRRDRAAARGEDYVPPPHEGGSSSSGYDVGSSSSTPSNPYNARDERRVAPRDSDFGPPPPIHRQPRPEESVGGRNEQDFGDRAKFGPGYEPPGAGRRPNNNNGPPRSNNNPPQTGWGARRQNQNAPANHGSSPSAGGAGGARSKEQRKPPIPKGAFGAKKDNKNGGGVGGGGGSRGQGPPSGVERYQGRPGDEDLVTLIESEMSSGPQNVGFDDVAGHKDAKETLEEAVIFPMMMPGYFTGIRRPWRGILLYGPPGTGKTMLAKAVATECKSTFFNISQATLTSKWRGDSEKLLRVLFEMARHYAPSTIFIDEIDSLCGERGGGSEHEASRRAKSVLLTQMDGVGVDQSKHVLVLGATNHPWDIDEAMRRRLEKRIYIPLPETEDIVALLHIHTKDIKVHEDVDFEELARMARRSHYSAADLTNVVRDASMMTMRRFMKKVNRNELKQNPNLGSNLQEDPVMMEDFIEAVRKVPSSVNLDQVKRFVEWGAEFSAAQ